MPKFQLLFGKVFYFCFHQKKRIMYTLLAQHLQKHIDISLEEAQDFCQLFELKCFKKKEFLLTQGEIYKIEAFVVSGLFKVFHTNNEGNEQILYFAAEDWWLSDLDSFFYQTPSRLSIQALENSEVLLIFKEKKQWAFDYIPYTERLFRIISQKGYTAMQRRMIGLLSQTAKQRYWEFWEQYPNIAKRLSNIQMAGYLGVSQEFVSKIRKVGSTNKR